MGPLARFLIALERLARRQGLKIEDAYKFAKQEFGEITPLLRKQIQNVYKKIKEKIPGKPGEKGRVIPFVKKTEGIETLDEFPDTRDNPLQPFDKDIIEGKTQLPKNPLDPAIGITRTAVRTILNRKGIDIAKGEDPIEIFRKTFGQDVLIDVNNVSEELLEMERMGKGFKGLDEILEQEGFFDLKIPKNPPQGMTDDELLKLMEEVEQEEILKKFDPKGRKPSATGGIAGILNL